jgi:hypothetical protein
MVVRTPALIISSTALVACTFDGDRDFAVVPSWAINGLAPTAEECAAYGVDHVELRITRPKTSRVIEADCGDAVEYDDGTMRFTLGGFVTTRHFEYGRAYEYELSLVDAAGKVVHGAQAVGSFEVTADDSVPWLLDPVEIFEPAGDVASYSAAWTVGDSLADGCRALGIARVALDLTTDYDVDLAHVVELASAPCEAGQIVSPGAELAVGSYVLRYVALDARDAVVDESPFIGVEVREPGEVKLDVVRFDGEIEDP